MPEQRPAATSRRSGHSRIPAGIATNERTSGVAQPSGTATVPKRSNQRSARAIRSGVSVQPACRSARAAGGRRSSRSPSRAPRRACCRRADDDDCEVGVEARTWKPAMSTVRERAGRERAAVDHRQLARRGQHGRDEHQDEDREQAVVADERRHARDSNDGTLKDTDAAPRCRRRSSTRTCATYVPANASEPPGSRPSQRSDRAPGCSATRGSARNDDAARRLDPKRHLGRAREREADRARSARRTRHGERRAASCRTGTCARPSTSGRGRRSAETFHRHVPSWSNVVGGERVCAGRVRDAALERVRRRRPGRRAWPSPSTGERPCTRAAPPRPGLAGEERQRRLGRVDAEVLDEQRLLDRTLGAAARPVEQPAVERGRDRVAGIDAGGGDGAEP